jgi:hypothetical protein
MTTNTNIEKTETLESKPTYRAPRLVALGSTVELVQSGIGDALDAPSGVLNKVRVRR